MIARYNHISLATGVPGIILQIVGNVMTNNPRNLLLGVLLAIAGTVLLLVGLAYYAMAKGRNPAWCLLAFLSIIGLIVLACLRDLTRDGNVSQGRSRRQREKDYDDDDDEEDRPQRRKRRREDDDDLDEEDVEDDRPPRKRPERRARRDEDEDFDDAPPPRKKQESAAEAAEVVVPDKQLVKCSACHKTLKVPANVTGKKVKCPSCGEIFVVR